MIRLYSSKVIAFILNKCMNPQMMCLKFNYNNNNNNNNRRKKLPVKCVLHFLVLKNFQS